VVSALQVVFSSAGFRYSSGGAKDSIGVALAGGIGFKLAITIGREIPNSKLVSKCTLLGVKLENPTHANVIFCITNYSSHRVK
jgi:hypothetical protein